MNSFYEDESRFVADLAAETELRQAVAHDCVDRGFWTRCPLTLVRDKFENRRDFADDGDVFVGVGPAQYEIIQVRGLDQEFGNEPVSYPRFPAGIITYDVASWSREKRHPMAIVFVSKRANGRLVVPTSTSDRWTTRVSYDRRTKTRRNFYHAPLDAIAPYELLFEMIQTRLDERIGRRNKTRRAA